MSVRVGDSIPSAKVKEMTDQGPVDHDTATLFQGKWVVFALPGAFTPTCSARHLPGYVEQADAFAAKGYKIACLSVNDAFVMGAWGKAQNTGDKVMMLADGNAEFTTALGLDLDATGFGMGIRAKRFAMIVEDGVIKALNIEPPGAFEVSSAEAMLAAV